MTAIYTTDDYMSDQCLFSMPGRRDKYRLGISELRPWVLWFTSKCRSGDNYIRYKRYLVQTIINHQMRALLMFGRTGSRGRALW